MPTVQEKIEGFSDTEVLARTLWGENRGGGVEGMQSVANVIVNRAASPGWWGDDIRGVCLKAEQFSCWNANDPNLMVMLNVNEYDVQYKTALDLATQAIAGTLEDITGGATYYFASSLKYPSWAEGHTPCADIRGQLFFNDID